MAKEPSRRSPLPEEMWTAAVELARRHGLYRTARALPIDYANLRKRLKRATRQASRLSMANQGLFRDGDGALPGTG
jgi:hypothetical protein